jgi:hypothetical protein
MDPRDPPLFRLWLLFFRTLCLGMLLMGSIVAVAGAMIAVAVLYTGRTPPGFSLGSGLLFLTVGTTFSVAGFRGFKMKSRRDLQADILNTASDRDKLERWINR